jgi:nickel-dependent lactate racemase
VTATAATPSGPLAALGGAGGVLDDEAVAAFLGEELAGWDLDGRSLLVVVPDGTRSCPLPLLLHAVHAAVHRRVSRLTVLVALGTHAPMGPEALTRHVGAGPGGPAQRYPGTRVVNHEWWDDATFATVGTLPAGLLRALSDGRIDRDVAVRVNRAVVEHDVTLLLGPVFPHEVVGFSGGTKYLVPGVSSREVIDVSHWLGALLTSAAIIGRTGATPVRALIDAAADLVATELRAACVVVSADGRHLHHLAVGDPRAAWAAAAAVSARTHVRYLDAPVQRVLSVVPAKYPDLWTGAKGFYKVEPVVADGGEVVLLAPHIRSVADTHPAVQRLGYHCRDYFLAHWDQVRGEPWGDLAHCTHLRGAGSYDPLAGERARLTVTLATAIPRTVVEAVGLAWRDPATIDPAVWSGDPSTLVVPDAGEVLYRLHERPAGPG